MSERDTWETIGGFYDLWIGHGRGARLRVTADSLDVSKDSDGLHYRFERSEIDHLYFGRMRVGRVPVPWMRYLHFVRSDGRRADLYFRPYAQDRAATFVQLAEFGWELRDRYGD